MGSAGIAIGSLGMDLDAFIFQDGGHFGVLRRSLIDASGKLLPGIVEIRAFRNDLLAFGELALLLVKLAT